MIDGFCFMDRYFLIIFPTGTHTHTHTHLYIYVYNGRNSADRKTSTEQIGETRRRVKRPFPLPSLVKRKRETARQRERGGKGGRRGREEGRKEREGNRKEQ